MLNLRGNNNWKVPGRLKVWKGMVLVKMLLDSELGTSTLLDDSGVYISDDDEIYDPDVDYKSDMEAKINQFAKECSMRNNIRTPDNFRRKLSFVRV